MLHRPLLTALALSAISLSGVIPNVLVSAAPSAGPSGCIAFDTNWNLLAFGFDGKDWNAGTQDTWASGSPAPVDITTSGRPPFNSVNTTCYLSQFTNAIYVLNADSANPSDISIYDATAKSWSTQKVTVGSGGFNPQDFVTILDHDTNVFYAYSSASLFSLDMALLKASTPTPIPWNTVQSPDLSAFPATAAVTTPQTPGANTQGYAPTIALAQNHVHFMGVPGLGEGAVKVFVIHFSFMQPAPQVYGNFPNSHGKTASFFLDQGVQQEFAYIPDDGSATYVVNVETNTTKTLTGPPTTDPFASYYASTSALVQLTTDGKVAFLAYDPATTTSGGTWTPISKLPTPSFASGGGSGSNGTGPSSSSGGGSLSNGGNNTTNGAKTGDAASVVLGAAGLKATLGALMALGVGSVLGVVF